MSRWKAEDIESEREEAMVRDVEFCGTQGHAKMYIEGLKVVPECAELVMRVGRRRRSTDLPNDCLALHTGGAEKDGGN